MSGVAWPPRAPTDPVWARIWHAFLSTRSGVALQAKLIGRLAGGAVVYPPDPLRALRLTPLDRVRVVILGQDPYHGPGQADGLAFSVPVGVRLPPSLLNVFKERQRDLGLPLPVDGSLVEWAKQGVLLLNTCLTVEAGQPASHAGWGWEAFTDEVIKACVQDHQPKAFLLWGAHAQKKLTLMDPTRHGVWCCNHPSPLAARRGSAPFMGCGHLGAVNRWLVTQGRTPVSW